MKIRTARRACLVIALALAGCVGDDTPPPVTETANVPAAQIEPDTGLDNIVVPDANRPAVAASPPEPPIPAHDTITGWDEVRITALLGQPDFRRTDAPAELWQYRMDGCVLDLFLYPASGGELAVDHLESRAMNAGNSRVNGDPQACFAAAVRAQRG